VDVALRGLRVHTLELRDGVEDSRTSSLLMLWASDTPLASTLHTRARGAVRLGFLSRTAPVVCAVGGSPFGNVVDPVQDDTPARLLGQYSSLKGLAKTSNTRPGPERSDRATGSGRADAAEDRATYARVSGIAYSSRVVSGRGIYRQGEEDGCIGIRPEESCRVSDVQVRLQ
jgi:hypothetical protein